MQLNFLYLHNIFGEHQKSFMYLAYFVVENLFAVKSEWMRRDRFEECSKAQGVLADYTPQCSLKVGAALRSKVTFSQDGGNSYVQTGLVSLHSNGVQQGHVRWAQGADRKAANQHHLIACPNVSLFEQRGIDMC